MHIKTHSFISRNFTDVEFAYCRAQQVLFAARWVGNDAAFKSLGISSTSSEVDNNSQTDSSSNIVAPSGSSRLSGKNHTIHLHRLHRGCYPLFTPLSSSFLLKMHRWLVGTLYTSGHAFGHMQINDTEAAIRLRTDMIPMKNGQRRHEEMSP